MSPGSDHGKCLTLAALLDTICPAASNATLEEYERTRHRDLPRLTRAELLRERDRVRLRLLLDDAPPHWCIERLSRLERAVQHASR
jgi:hypothetical protein